MAPSNPNRPKLRKFSLPLGGIAGTSALILSLAFAAFGPPGQFSFAGLNFPFTGILRTVFQWINYAILATHFWEAYTAWSICATHKSSPPVSALYTISTFVFGFPVLDEMKRLIQIAKVDAITSSQKAK